MDRSVVRLTLFASVLCTAFAGCVSAGTHKRADKKQAQQFYRLAQLDFAQGKNQEALTHLKRSLQLDSKNADVHNYLGIVHVLLSDFQSAERELEEALKINPYLTDAKNSLGAVYMKTGRPERARSTFEEALKDKTYPNPEKILYNLGSLDLELKRYPEAMESFHKAVAASPNYAKGYYGLALAFAGTGRSDDARLNFQRVITLDPNSPEAARARQYLAEPPPRKKG